MRDFCFYENSVEETNMKKIEAVIRPERFPAISAALQEAEKNGMTVSEVRGHGSELSAVQVWRGRQYKVDLHQKLKLEIVVQDADVDQVVNMIIDEAQTGANGDGRIFVSHVESDIRIRTGEVGDRAITNGRVVKLSPKEETENISAKPKSQKINAPAVVAIKQCVI